MRQEQNLQKLEIGTASADLSKRSGADLLASKALTSKVYFSRTRDKNQCFRNVLGCNLQMLVYLGSITDIVSVRSILAIVGVSWASAFLVKAD